MLQKFGQRWQVLPDVTKVRPIFNRFCEVSPYWLNGSASAAADLRLFGSARMSTAPTNLPRFYSDVNESSTYDGGEGGWLVSDEG